MFLIRFFGMIIGFFRRIGQRNQNERQLNNIEVQNERLRNVSTYRSAPIEAFVVRHRRGNILVSGNNQSIKNRVSCVAAYNSCLRRKPVVILHCGNSELERLISEAYSTEYMHYIINRNNPIYDPFLGLSKEEISQLVVTASSGSNRVERIGGIGGTYINGLTDYLLANGRTPVASSYIRCPHDELLSRVLRHQENGEISDADARHITDEITQGKSEQGKVEQCFRVLNTQASCILSRSADWAISIRKAIDENETISIDLVSASNDLLISMVLQEIRDAMSMGKEFLLVLDSIPIDASESLGQLIRNYSSSCNFVYASSDAYSDTQSTANVFETLLAKSNTVFVMQHNSANTNKKFSEYFGEYQRVEINTTYASGDTYATYGQILPGSSNSNITSTQRVNKPRVEERDIASLSYDELYIKCDSNQEIIHVRSTDGVATGRYEQPRRLHAQSSRIRTRRINWLVFFLLFFAFPPAAFIYSLVVCGRTGKIVSAIFLVLTVALIITYFVLLHVNGII